MIIRTLIAAALAATTIVPAQAQDYSVRYQAAELQSASGRDAVLKRIDRIARQHCETNLAPAKAVRTCMTKVSNAFFAKIGNPSLTAMRNTPGVVTASTAK